MRIGSAARLLGTTPRMLRYREALGLLPRARSAPEHARHRRYSPDDLEAVRLGLELEQRYDITPTALAFALRVATEGQVAAGVRELARRLDRLPTLEARAAELERQRALHWLGRSGVLAPLRR